jgi:hypothetical protein
MTSTSSVKQTSTVRRTVFAAACTLGIASAALFAHHAAAQTAKPSALHRSVPGHSFEMIGPTAAITSTAHYQAQIGLTCGGACEGDFRRPAANHQLNITRISCVLIATAGSEFLDGIISLETATDILLGEYLPVDFSSSGGRHSLNRAVDLQIAANQHMHVLLDLASGTPTAAFCTATGTLSTLG